MLILIIPLKMIRNDQKNIFIFCTYRNNINYSTLFNGHISP